MATVKLLLMVAYNVSLLVGLVLLLLRLDGAIDWPWWMVLMPLYGPPALAAAAVLLLTALLALAGGVSRD